jgi:60S ribosome subunit biogenesis protein NIP7
LIYSKPAKNERTVINRALNRWGAFEYFKDKHLVVGKYNEEKKAFVFLVNKKLEQVATDLADPYTVGLAIGELGKKQLIPSIAGADLFARHGKQNEFYIVVGEKGEKLVLYGRDIMGESIIEASDKLAENELVIVLNRSSDAIALGRTRFPGRLLFQKGKVTISTIADAGYYLREEGQS